MRSTTLSLAFACAALALGGCSKSEAPAADFKDNVEKTVGEPQQSQGMFGGNSAPADAGGAQAADTADAGCAVAGRGCAATPTAADAGS